MDNEKSIFRSLEIIESRITEKLTVENIASDVYFSKYHYQRLFREIVGDSVMEYVTNRKLTLAGKALLETDATVLDIALDYGYDSRKGFSRSFKAYMGGNANGIPQIRPRRNLSKNSKGEMCYVVFKNN